MKNCQYFKLFFLQPQKKQPITSKLNNFYRQSSINQVTLRFIYLALTFTTEQHSNPDITRVEKDFATSDTS